MQTLQEFRAERGRTIAEKYNLDLYILSLPENIEYFSGFYPFTINMLYSAEGYLVYDPHTGKQAMVTAASDIPTLIEEDYKGGTYVVGAFKFYNPSTEGFADKIRNMTQKRFSCTAEAILAAMHDIAPDAKRVLFDESHTPIGTWRAVTEKHPEICFEEGAALLREVKYLKHLEEIQNLKIAANIAEDALMSTLSYIRPGISEYDIETHYLREVALRRCDPYFIVATANERAAFSDTVNRSTEIIRDGSMVRFDFGCIYKRYRSDLARTVVVGNNPKAEAYYQAILQGQERAIEAIRPGVTAGEIFDIAVKETRKGGIPHYERHHVGHGIGLATYDLPSIAPGNNTCLEEGMVLCIETPYYEIGWGGVQVEDTVVITKNGAKYLTKTPRTLIKL